MAEGEVRVYGADIIPCTDKANNWEVRMLVAARDSVKKSDVVLVIDTSASMQGTRLLKAKEAANAFVDNLLNDTTEIRIGVVSYSEKGVVVHNLSDNKTALHASINSLTAKNGTNTQDGMHQAKLMLDGGGAVKKYMVLLSDGAPTYSVKINNPTNYLITDPNNSSRKITSTTVPKNQYNYSERVGDGSNILLQINNNSFYHHGNSAIAESRFIKDPLGTNATNAMVYTVGLDTVTNGSNILKQIASSPGDFYEVQNVDQLIPVFHDISENILASTKEAKVDFSFTQGFTLPEFFIPIDQITSPGTEIVNESGHPRWHIGTVSNLYPGTTDIKYEYFVLRITINDNILELVDPSLAVPIDNASFTYNDIDGSPQTILVSSDSVTPNLFVVKKNVDFVAGPGDASKRYFLIDVEVNESGSWVHHETLKVRHNQSKILNNLNLSSQYRVFETNIGRAYNEDDTHYLEFEIDDYYNNSTIKIDGVPQTGSLPNGGITPPAVVSVLPKLAGEGGRLDILVNNGEIENKAKLTLEKVLENTVFLPKEFNFTLQCDCGVPCECTTKYISINMDEGETSKSVTRDDFNFTNYTIMENTTNIAPYVPNADDQGKTFAITLYDVLSDTVNGKNVTFTNEFDLEGPGNLFDVSVKKVWENGNESNHTEVDMRLFSQKPGNQAELVTESYVYDSASSTYTWKDLPRATETDLINYYVREFFEEVEIVEGGSIGDYKVSYTGNVNDRNLTVTNTYQIPTNGEATATKVWVDGPSTKPTVWFKLYRNIEGGEAEEVPDAEIKELVSGTDSVTWDNLNETDISGNAYTFTVKEVDSNGTELSLDNYTKSEDGLTVTNTYQIPTNGEATATKEWVDGPSNKPTVWFKLYRNIDNGTVEEVPEAEAPIKELVSGTDSVTWDNLNETDINGNVYTFTVKEVDSSGTDLSFVPDNYTKSESGLTVTNTYQIPTSGTATATKEWVDGPDTKPTVWFKLYRNIDNGTVEEVPEAEAPIKELVSGTDSVTWDNLNETDINGNVYTFTVKEVDSSGTDLSFVPDNYTKSENGLTVTNTYQIPTNGEATATKEWVDGPSNKPTVWFKLYRNIDNGTVEEVPEAEAPIKELLNGTESVTWDNLNETDISGNAYTFTVKEVDSSGTVLSFVPDNYTKSENGLTVTNTYQIPTSGEATATKEWVDGPDTKPTVWFKLYRNIDNGTVEEVPETEAPIKELVNGTESVTWDNLEQTDINGNAYTFIVKEVDSSGTDLSFVPDNYTKSESGLTVTNTYQIPTSGTATATKEWVDGPDTKPTVWFKLYRNIEGGEAEEVPESEAPIKELVNGTDSVTWDNLNETDISGNAYTFTVKEVNEEGNDWSPNGYDKDENGLIITNTYVNSVISYNIEYDLTKTLTDNPATTAEENSLYEATLTAEDGYVLKIIKVFMGEEDVTDSVVTDNKVTIESVIGDVKIIAVSEVSDKLYTVSYDVNGGDKPAPDSVTGPSGHVFIVASYDGKYIGDSSDNGKELVFGGWILEVVSKKYMPGDRFKMSSSDAVLKALWIDPNAPVPTETYVVTYKECDRIIDKKEFAPGEYITFDVTIPYNRGFYPGGWTYNGHLIDETTVVNQNMIVDLVWKPLPRTAGSSLNASLKDVIILLQYTAGVGPLKDVPESKMIKMGFDLNNDKKIDLIDVIIYLRAV